MVIALGLAKEHFGHAAATHAEQSPAWLTLLAGEVGDQWRNEAWVELVAKRSEQALGHAGERQWCNGVGLDVVLGALDGEHAGESNEPHLCGAIVGLAEVAEDTRGR